MNYWKSLCLLYGQISELVKSEELEICTRRLFFADLENIRLLIIKNFGVFFYPSAESGIVFFSQESEYDKVSHRLWFSSIASTNKEAYYQTSSQ